MPNMREIAEKVKGAFERAIQESEGETIGEAIQMFLDERRRLGRSEKTIEWYAGKLRLMFTDFLEMDAPVSRLTDPVIYELQQVLGKRVPNPVTYNGYVRTLKAFLNFLQDMDRPIAVRTNRISQVTVDRHKPVELTMEEITNLLATYDHSVYGVRDHTITALLLDTGLRISEALNILIEDLDIPRITVRNTKANRDREVMMSDPMVANMRRWLRLRRTAGNKGFLFVSDQSDRLSYHRFRSVFVEHVRQAGITKRVSIHTLRHTYAQIAIRTGMPLSAVQRTLGHSTSAMTLQYARMSDPVAQAQSVQHSPLAQLEQQREDERKETGPTIKDIRRKRR